MRKVIYIFVSLLVITLLIVVPSVIRVMIDSSNPLRKPVEQIKENILELTPIGTNMTKIIEVIENNKGWKITYVNSEGGVPYAELGRRRKPTDIELNRPSMIGEKSIRILIGTYTGGMYFDGNPLNTLYTASIKTHVSVFFAFDENSNLIDIIPQKQSEGF